MSNKLLRLNETIVVNGENLSFQTEFRQLTQLIVELDKKDLRTERVENGQIISPNVRHIVQSLNQSNLEHPYSFREE